MLKLSALLVATTVCLLTACAHPHALSPRLEPVVLRTTMASGPLPSPQSLAPNRHDVENHQSHAERDASEVFRAMHDDLLHAWHRVQPSRPGPGTSSITASARPTRRSCVAEVDEDSLL